MLNEQASALLPPWCLLHPQLQPPLPAYPSPLLPHRSALWRRSTRRRQRRRRSRRRGASAGAAAAPPRPRRPSPTLGRSRRCCLGARRRRARARLHPILRTKSGPARLHRALEAAASARTSRPPAAPNSLRLLGPGACPAAPCACASRPAVGRSVAGDVPRLQGRAARLPAQGSEVAHLAVEQRPQRHPGRPDGALACSLSLFQSHKHLQMTKLGSLISSRPCVCAPGHSPPSG